MPGLHGDRTGRACRGIAGQASGEVDTPVQPARLARQGQKFSIRDLLIEHH